MTQSIPTVDILLTAARTILTLQTALREIAKAVDCKETLPDKFKIEDVIAAVRDMVETLDKERAAAEARVDYWKAAVRVAERECDCRMASEGVGDENKCLLEYIKAQEKENAAKEILDNLGIEP